VMVYLSSDWFCIDPSSLNAVIQASADRAPPLLEVAAAIAAAPNLAPLLGDQAPAGGADAAWATEQHLGSRCVMERTWQLSKKRKEPALQAVPPYACRLL